MKKLESLIIFSIFVAFAGNLLATRTAAQQISSGTQTPTGKMTAQDEPPVRNPAQVEVFRRLIAAATANGNVVVTYGSRDDVDRAEVLRQLAPFQVRLITLFNAPYAAIEADAAALIYMRDSPLVTAVQASSLVFPAGSPVRSPEELAYLYGLIQKAQRDETMRVVISLKTNVTPEEYLTIGQRTAQREAIALTQDELLRSLVPYGAALVARYESVPYLVLDVNASAINLMIYSPLVVGIREDRVRIQIRKSRLGL